MPRHRQHHADKQQSSLLDKADAVNRLNRIRGQLEGIVKMVERGEYCVNLITQCRAVKGALTKVEEIVLEAHLKSCVIRAIEDGNAEEFIEEILELYKINSKKNNLVFA
ncbi:MAG: metal-sensitive transcriptional regulator [Candidatus Caenarcaniphilales bacterium]|nr:metal-sensitive transcriptional regulator [Candidatus Caenarcaniphilales bacterium]